MMPLDSWTGRYRPGCTSMAAIQALELTATAGHTFPVSTSLFPPQP